VLKRLFQRKPDKNLSCEIINSGFSFDLEHKVTILQSALNAGVSLPHNCQVGSCKECSCKLVDGDIKSHVELGYLFNKEEIEAGYFLPCQSVAKSNVVIEPLKALATKESLVVAIITSVKRLTHSISRLEVKSEQPLEPAPGQYCHVHIPAIGQYRSYSFSKQNDENNTYCFDITHHEGGQVSSWLLDENHVGETIQLSHPLGDFSLKEASGPILCIAGGSGQGAVLNVIKHCLEEIATRPVYFLYSAKSETGLYAQDELDAIAKEIELTYTPFLTEQSSWTGKTGRIPAQLKGELNSISEGSNGSVDYSQWSVLLCGAPGLINDSLHVLEELGFVQSLISFDKFDISGG